MLKLKFKMYNSWFKWHNMWSVYHIKQAQKHVNREKYINEVLKGIANELSSNN